MRPRQSQSEFGEALPRIVLFLFNVRDHYFLRASLERVPPAALKWVDEIVAMEDQNPGNLGSITEDGGLPHVLVHRTPTNLGHGGVRKAALEYALHRNADLAVFMDAELHSPEMLPALIYPLLVDGRGVVLASRLMQGHDARPRSRPTARGLARVIATQLQNRILGLRLSDYHTSFRVLSMRTMRGIPFQLNADDRRFDMQLLIQCRALDAPFHEVAAASGWREYPTDGAGLHGWVRGYCTALDYRFHQLHVTRRGRYLVDDGVHYTLKRSHTSSHTQIVDAIRLESHVLDLGCSQGLLASPLHEKGTRVTGVDSGRGDNLAPELEEYYQRDLEEPLILPRGRVYDYVVVSDVIEHLRNRIQLLSNVRRFLKPGGRLIVSTPNIALWFYRLSLLLGRFEYGPRGVLDEGHVHLFTRETFRREVTRAGFHVVHERFTSLPFEVVFRSTGRSRTVRELDRLYHLLARMWPELFAYQFILEAEITTLDEESTTSRVGLVPQRQVDMEVDTEQEDPATGCLVE